MFHRQNGIPSASGSRHGGTSATLLNNHHQNENMIHPHSSNAHKKGVGGGVAVDKDISHVDAKTPANKGTPYRRRALGDISNKKQTIVGGVGGGRTGFKNPEDDLKSRYSNIPSSGAISATTKITGTSHQFAAASPQTAIQASFIPRLSTNNNTSQSTVLKSKTNEPVRQPLTVIPSTSTAEREKKHNSNLKHLATIDSESLSTATTSTTQRRVVRIEEPVPDIELPAGRTWRQQLEYDLLDDDDVASTSSIDSFHPKDRSMWDDWGESVWAYRLAQERKEAEEEALEADRLVREQIEKMLDKEAEEQQRGLEALYDVIDNLDFLGDASLEAAWSLPASSRCGDDENSNLIDDELAFEI
jgi:hypothetical protein